MPGGRHSTPRSQGLIGATLFRLPKHLDATGILWMLSELLLSIAGMACRRYLRGRLAAWRELPAVLFQLIATGGGRVGPALKGAVDEWESVRGTLRAAALLVFSSDVCVQLLAWGKPLRLW